MQNLIIDIKTSDEILTNVDKGFRILKGLIKINRFTPVKYEEHVFPNSAYSAFFLLAESHISIHSWLEERYLSIELFGCTKLDIDRSLEYLRECVQIDRIKYSVITRGF